uniref:Metalloserrulase 8 n=1 Tax=Tityus serrulatus TaxID=6887 RepID=A0A076L3I6_TITSE|nr:metalloserrulase 8 [Tityus serrulatus]
MFLQFKTTMYFASFFLFATVSAIPNGRVHVVFPTVETSRSGEKTLKLRAFDRDIELNLQPAGEILAKNFGIMDDDHRLFHPVDVKNLQRKLYKNSANGAALLIDEDGPVTIEGNINAKVRIAPYESGGMDEAGRIAHWIEEEERDEKAYLRDDSTYFFNLWQELPPDIDTENTKRMDREGKCIVIEILSVTDSNFTKRFSNYEELSEYITLTYAGVQTIMDTLELGIKLRLIGIHAFTNETEPPFIESNAIPGHERYVEYRRVLNSMKRYYCEHDYGLAKDADIIILTNDRLLAGWDGGPNINTNVAGVAIHSGACDQCSKVAVSEHSSSYFIRVIYLTHETAHSIGIDHDGGGRSKNCSNGKGGFMGRSDSSLHPTFQNFRDYRDEAFSECSKENAKYFLSTSKADCLFEECPNDNITSLFET